MKALVKALIKDGSFHCGINLITAIECIVKDMGFKILNITTEAHNQNV